MIHPPGTMHIHNIVFKTPIMYPKIHNTTICVHVGDTNGHQSNFLGTMNVPNTVTSQLNNNSLWTEVLEQQTK